VAFFKGPGYTTALVAVTPYKLRLSDVLEIEKLSISVRSTSVR